VTIDRSLLPGSSKANTAADILVGWAVKTASSQFFLLSPLDAASSYSPDVAHILQQYIVNIEIDS